jgi:polysaccharide export outer membrane protein
MKSLAALVLLALQAMTGADPRIQELLPRPVVRSSDYQIGPDDILHVSVLGHEDLDLSVLVQADGGFIFPLVGRVMARDLTPAELEQQLAASLARGFIRDPQVTVVVEEFRSKTVLVMGEVLRPGPYPLTGSMRVVEVLATAGMKPEAAQEVLVVRAGSDAAVDPEAALGGASGAEILRVDMVAIQAGDLSQNIPLQPGDTVFVPPPPRFYVQGVVRSPGAYPLTPGLTLREAITVAGGFAPGASEGRTRVIREIGGEKREIKVDLDAPIRAGDTIVVKGSLF